MLKRDRIEIFHILRSTSKFIYLEPLTEKLKNNSDCRYFIDIVENLGL